ncbi:SusD/RagB family nutrient-binding outer membrane lipoprotein [Niabella drilacis]|uniref:Starch-binding associating with outer membrane n=1 Tax=Niabella drilacis (strain DSM 25811 / CCM 8410 / CCUG 62505 / LMG 26954 / E90) TaxID=1285928 RepID=A0A1G6KXN9_NIADE|nr:SusD/RagB family nutrient-binding outer membrane lipoprotein [Niabella drilacis]SDC35840.1 Starch-binding associating with outer membrane [Niabella drilacis]
MKKINIFNIIIVALAGSLLTSCSKKAMDDVNMDRNHTQDVPARFILTDAMTATAFNVVGGDVSLYASIYLEHEGGVWNQAYQSENRITQPTSATTYNNSWDAVYNNIKALKIAVSKTAQGGSEEGNDVTGGIAKVLLAYNLGVLTDLYGDVPYQQTGIMNEDGTPKYMQPAIDKQSDLYTEIQKLLDEAITQLAGSDASLIGGIVANKNQDLLYGAKANLWTKAAYGLKARYLMHTLKVSADVNGDLNKILNYVSKSFADASEEMKFDLYDGSSNINPLYGISSSRDMLGASKSLATKFKNTNDPRGNQVFVTYGGKLLTNDAAITNGVPNGEAEQVQFTYPIAILDYASTAPTLLLSYHEVLFLKAEALARLNRGAEASEPLHEAIVAAFANLEQSIESGNSGLMDALGTSKTIVTPDLSESVANDYFTTSVLPRFAQNALKEVVLQKYLAFFGASGESTEAYNDYRRLKALGQEDFIGLANPLNAQAKFPLRYTYGNSDVTANQAIKAAFGDGSYVYKENVWWAGGSR